jgi:zinc transport system substrate-binding protein
MNKKKLAIVITLVVVALGVIVARSQTESAHTDNGKLKVAASYYPLYDFAKNVGGDKIEASNVTPAGAEPHDYEPSPKTLAGIQDVPVFIYNGGHMEPWVDIFLKDYRHDAVRASDGIDLMTAEDEDHPSETVKDPHFWLDPVLAQKIVTNIRDGLSHADPANKAYYADKASDYLAKLEQLDAAYRNGLATCKRRTVMSSHDAFSYVGKRYTLTVVSIAGISPEEEPSAAKLAELSDLAKKKGIRYVFFESMVSPRLANTVAAETGAKTLVFDPVEGLSEADQKAGKDYLSVQRENLHNLRTALECK